MRKHTRRRVYELVNPISMAIAGCAITDTARLDKLRMLELQALEAFRTGKATRDDWRSLADMLNVAQVMAEQGIGPEVLAACEAAEEALQGAHARFTAGKSLGFDGPGLQAMRELFAFHDLQRSSVSRSAYEAAIKKTSNRILSSHPSLKVVL